MATVEELVVKLTAETSDLRAELKGAQVALAKSTDAMTKAVDNFAKDGAKSTSFFQQAWATMAGFVGGQLVTRALDSATGLFKGLFNTLIVDGIAASSETQIAMNDLLNAVARSGQSAKGATAEFEAFAGSIQNTTKFGDDAALSAAALIQNIARLDKEALKGATTAAVDLAAAMNLDLNTASQLVGKAIEGNVGALSRYGIKVEEGRTKTETFSNVMNALNSQFGGAAASQLQTYSGSMTALGNTFSDFTKVFGQGITNNVAFINVINEIKDIVAEFGASFDLKSVREFFAQGLNYAINFAAGLVSLSSPIEAAARGIMDIFTGLGEMLGSTASAVLSLAKGDFQQAFDTIKESANQTLGEFGDNTALTDAMAESLGRIKGAAEAGLEATRAGMVALQEPTKTAGMAVDELSAKMQFLDELSKQRAQSALEATYTIADANAIELDSMQNLFENQLISLDEYNQGKFDLLAAQQAEEYALMLQGLDQSKATAEEKARVLGDLEQKQANERNKLLDEQKKREDELNKQKVQALSQTFGNLAVLSESGNKELAAIGKASAIAQATIDGFAAVQKALASAPPPFNFALAASVGVATAANVAKIGSTPLATGIDSVPGIGSADNFPAILAPGERVVPSETNRDLTRFLANQQNQGPNITVNVQMNDVFTSDPREMGLKIVNVINEVATANGVKILGSSIA